MCVCECVCVCVRVCVCSSVTHQLFHPVKLCEMAVTIVFVLLETFDKAMCMLVLLMKDSMPATNQAYSKWHVYYRPCCALLQSHGTQLVSETLMVLLYKDMYCHVHVCTYMRRMMAYCSLGRALSL